MSGHSKWSSIKHKKGANDAKRGQVFTKMANLIAAAARAGGSDPDANVRLRMAIDTAKKSNLPKDNIERAIKRGTGELEGAVIEEFIMEGFGPGGTGLIIEVISDNKNRSLAEIRNIMSKNGGIVADKGSVTHLFEQKGIIRGPLKEMTDSVEEIIIESGAEDYSLAERVLTVETARADLKSVKDILEKNKIKISEVDLEYVAQTEMEIDTTTEEKLLALLQTLDDNDDVANVSTNAKDI